MCDGLEAVQCDVGLQALSSRHPQVSQRPDYYLTSALEPEVQPATGLEVLASSDLESAEKVISYVQLQEFLGQHYGLEPSEQSPKYKRSCGIKVVIICFVVLAFALGVAGSFMVNQMIHASTRSTPSLLTTALMPTSPQISSSPTLNYQLHPVGALSLRMDCPSSDGHNYTTPSGEVYYKHCGVDWPVGEAAVNGQGTVQDLLTVKTFTFDGCIDACSTYNGDGPHRICVGLGLINRAWWIKGQARG
ncbi:hypothetical protein MMC12_003243 [Toensbergia leucococca]|nr:hypothetical protein [Toensbergia leucococca]